MTSAVIVAAGSSRRMGFDKLFAPLASQAVIAYSLQTFLEHPLIQEVVVVSSPENRERLSAMSGRIRVVEGGRERCDSVWNGLAAVSSASRYVAIHDGARPLIHPDSITAGIHSAQKHGAAALARPVTETVKRADEAGQVIASVDRAGLWAMETPQCFLLDLLRTAWEKVRHRGIVFTDEVSILEEAGLPVFLVENPYPNPKITFPHDLDLAEKLLDRPRS
jgi:2-C-methyl-D-erythritol 4-phosphate cytidylyltransferase